MGRRDRAAHASRKPPQTGQLTEIGPDNALIIRVRRVPGHAILTAAGEIDIATVARAQ